MGGLEGGYQWGGSQLGRGKIPSKKRCVGVVLRFLEGKICICAMAFEWPPELEEVIYDLIRTHIRCELKRRTWDALHKELMTEVGGRHFRNAILRLCNGDESNSAFILNWIGHMLHLPTEQSVYLAVA